MIPYKARDVFKTLSNICDWVFFVKIAQGYLRFQMITFSKCTISGTGWTQESHARFLNYPIFCISNHTANFQICDVMMSIDARRKVHFWAYLLNCNSLGYETSSTNIHKQAWYFSEIFWNNFEYWDKVSGRFWLTNLLLVLNNHLKEVSSFSLIWKRELGPLKLLVNINSWKLTELVMLPFY